MSGTSAALESLETSFHQDLNGDGVIGVPGTVIEAIGSTSLVEVGTKFFLDSISTGSGPSLKYGGADCCCGPVWCAGHQSAPSRRQPAMRWPGRYRLPTSISSGTPTATATTSHRHGSDVGNQRCAGIA